MRVFPPGAPPGDPPGGSPGGSPRGSPRDPPLGDPPGDPQGPWGSTGEPLGDPLEDPPGGPGGLPGGSPGGPPRGTFYTRYARDFPLNASLERLWRQRCPQIVFLRRRGPRLMPSAAQATRGLSSSRTPPRAVARRLLCRRSPRALAQSQRCMAVLCPSAVARRPQRRITPKTLIIVPMDGNRSAPGSQQVAQNSPTRTSPGTAPQNPTTWQNYITFFL